MHYDVIEMRAEGNVAGGVVQRHVADENEELGYGHMTVSKEGAGADRLSGATATCRAAEVIAVCDECGV